MIPNKESLTREVGLRDISSQYNFYHHMPCPCGQEVNDFMDKYKPEMTNKNTSATEILLVSGIPPDRKDI